MWKVVVIPISKGKGEEHEKINARANEIVAALKSRNVRAKVDTRSNMRPGAKYFEWERKGLPIRLDIGAREVAANTVILSTRLDESKSSISTDGQNYLKIIVDMLESVQNELLNKAKQRLALMTHKVETYSEMKSMLSAASDGDLNQSGFFLVPWKCDAENEAFIKEDSKATIRCYPLDENETPPALGTKCFFSGDQATHFAIFARAF